MTRRAWEGRRQARRAFAALRAVAVGRRADRGSAGAPRGRQKTFMRTACSRCRCTTTSPSSTRDNPGPCMGSPPRPPGHRMVRGGQLELLRTRRSTVTRPTGRQNARVTGTTREWRIWCVVGVSPPSFVRHFKPNRVVEIGAGPLNTDIPGRDRHERDRHADHDRSQSG